MKTVTRLAALKNAAGIAGRMEFWGNDRPKCPHCGEDYNIDEHEAYFLYEEGEHDVTCSGCDHDFTVSTMVSFSFSTDQQEDET